MYLKYKYFVISINTKPVHKQIQVWPEVSSEALQDCCNATGWNMFKQAATYNNTTDLQEYSETVTAYITKCIDDVTVTKTITVRANQKPWLTGEVYTLLKYSRRITHRFSDSRDTRSLWQGIQTITDYKPPCPARFEAQNSTTAQKTPPPPSNQVMQDQCTQSPWS